MFAHSFHIHLKLVLQRITEANISRSALLCHTHPLFFKQITGITDNMVPYSLNVSGYFLDLKLAAGIVVFIVYRIDSYGAQIRVGWD